jgi:hypothetical protein
MPLISLQGLLELGALSAAPPRRSTFWRPFVRSYEKAAIILTAKRPPEDHDQLVGDAATTGAMMDRFLHYAEVVSLSSMEETAACNIAESSEPKTKKLC